MDSLSCVECILIKRCSHVRDTVTIEKTFLQTADAKKSKSMTAKRKGAVIKFMAI
jgi:3-polyprenyl-4-hydroxybenzoate decarboxylase